MNSSHFDELTKALATATTRRQALQRIGGILGGTALAGLLPGLALASNSDCAHFCNAVFGKGTPAQSQCASDGAHGKGLCYTCGPASPGGTKPICCQENPNGTCTSYSSATCCPSGQTCNNGQCVAICPPLPACNATCPCPSGDTCCNGTCTNTQTDNNNCGSCGNICFGCTTCSGGTCVSSCGYGQNCTDGHCGGPNYFQCMCNDGTQPFICTTSVCADELRGVCTSLCANHGGYNPTGDSCVNNAPQCG
jgi:hypothetical protein